MSNLSPARRVALAATRQVRERNAFAKQAVATCAASERLSKADDAFAVLLACGVASCSCVLDDIIDRNLNHPYDIKDDVRDALRISAYEMAFLDKSPHAAVDQGVELARSVAPRAAGLANAVLRKMARSLTDFPWGDPETDDAALARQHGFPLWMVRQLIAERGRAACVSFLNACDKPAPLYVAANPFKLEDAAALKLIGSNGAMATPFGAPGCFRVEGGEDLLDGAAVNDGRLIVADASSQCVAWLAHPRTRGNFLEVASGRGTKTVLLQGQSRREGEGPAHLFALDVHDFKCKVLTDRMRVCGVPEVTALCGDATNLDMVRGLPKSFDSVFIDAPCSGLGTLRRHPEQRQRLRPEDIDSLSNLGLSMLASAASRLDVGGSVVYATCSVSPRENEGLIARFLDSAQGRGFEVQPFGDQLPEGYSSCQTADGFFQSFPTVDGPDGHFAACLVRRH